MIFYFYNRQIGNTYIFGSKYNSYTAFISYVQNLNVAHGNLFTEVPRLCIKKLYGSCDWTGYKYDALLLKNFIPSKTRRTRMSF